MKNLFRYFVVNPLLVLLVLVVLLLTGVALLSLTQTGTHVLVNLAGRFVPALKMEGVQGTLASGLKVDSVLWEQDDIKVDAQQAVFKPDIDWTIPLQVNIEQLTAERLVIDIPETADTPYEPITLGDFSLPIDTNLNNIAVDRLIINQGEAVFHIREVVLDAKTRNDILYLHNLDGYLSEDFRTIRVHGEGQMALDRPHPLQAKVTVDADTERLGLGNLILDAQGEVQNYQVQLGGDWKYGDYPAYQVLASGEGNFEGLKLDKVQLAGDAGDIALQGEVIWAPDLKWDFAGQAQDLKPEFFVPEVDGNLDVKLSSSGEMVNELETSLKVSEIKGTLRGFPLQASLDAEVQDENLILRDLDALVGDNRLTAQGEANDQLDIVWKLDAPKLGQFHPELSGQLTGNGQLAGKVDGSQFKLEINRLSGEVLDYPVQAGGALRLEDQVVSADQLRVEVGKNYVSLDGNADEATGLDWVIDAPELAALHPELSGQLQGKGNAKGLLDGSRMALRVDNLAGEVKDYPLAASGEIRLEDQLVSAENFKVNVGENSVQLDGVANEAEGVDWVVDAPQLSLLHSDLAGYLKGQGNAKGLLDGSRIALQVDTLEGQVQEYAVSAAGAVRLDDQLVSAENFRVNIGENKIRLDGNADEQSGLDWVLDAPELVTLHPTLSGYLKGQGNAKGLLDGSRLSLKIDQLSGDVKNYPVSASGEIKLRDQLVSAENFLVDVGGNTLELNGVANEAEGIDWTINAPELVQLYPTVNGRLQGQGNAKGLLDGSRLSVNVAQLAGEVNDYPVSAQGEIKLRNDLLSAESFVVNVGDNNVELNGVANETVGIDWLINAPELAQLHPELSGELQGQGNAKGLLDGSRMSVNVERLAGEVKGYPVAVNGAIKLKNELLSAENFQLEVGDNKLDLNGVANETEGLNWVIDAPKLTQLYPDLSGQLNGRGNAKGLLDGSRVSVNIMQLEGQVNDYPVSASGEVKLRNQLVSAEALSINVGDNKVELNGVANEEQGIDWLVDAPQLMQLHPELSGELQGDGNAKGLLDGSRLSVKINQLEGEVKDYPVFAKGAINLDGQLVKAEDFQIRVGDNRIELNGVANEEQGIDWAIDAPELSQLYTELSGKLQGEGNAKGLLDGSRFAVRVDQLEGEVQDYPVSARGAIKLEDQLVSAERFRIDVADNVITLNGVANEEQGIDWTIDADELEKLYPEISGRLEGQGNAKGLLDGSRLSLQVAQLRGEVNDYPVSARGEIKLRNKLVSADNFRINVGDNRVELNGVANEDEGVDWIINAPELAQLHPELSGRLAGNGNAKGLLDGSRFSVEVEQLAGQVNDYPLAASGQIKLRNQLMTAENFKLNVGENTLALNGVANEAEGIDWVVDAPQLAQLHPELMGRLQGQGNAKGLLDGSRLAVQVAELEGRVNDYPLSAQGTIRLRNQLISAESFRVNVGENSVKLNGVANESQGLDWVVDAPQLAQFDPALSGSVQGKGNAKGLLDGSRLSLKVDELSGNVNSYPVSAQGQLKLRNQLLSAQAFQVSVGDNTMKLDGVANEAEGVDWVVNAPQLTQLHPELSGQLRGNGNARGLLDGSRLSVQVAQLAGEVRDYPVAARGEIALNDQLVSAENFQVNVGDNAVRLNGVANESEGVDWVIDAPRLVQFHPELTGNLQGKGNAKVVLDGSRVAFQVDRLEGTVRDYPVAAQGEVKLTDQQVSANDFQLSVGTNNLSLDGVANEMDGISWKLDAPQLAQLHPELSGDLQGNGHAKGQLDGSRLALEIDQLSGEVRDYPVSAQGEIKLNNQLLSAESVRVSVGDNKLVLDGVANEAVGIDWQVDAPKLTQLYPTISGNVQAKGRANGQLDGSSLTLQIMQLKGNVNDYPLSGQGGIQLKDEQLSVQDFRVSVGNNNVELNGLVNDGEGARWVINAPKLAQLHPELTGQLQGEGQAMALLDGSRLSLAVNQFSGEVKNYPISARGEVKLADQLVSAENFQVNVGDNEIVLNGVANEAQGIDWRVDAPKLAQLYPDISGHIQGRGNAKGLLDGSRLSLAVAQLAGTVNDYPVSAQGQIKLNDQLLSAENFLVQVGENTVKLDGVANQSKGVDWRVDAPKLAQLHPTLNGNVRGNGNVKGLLDGSSLTLRVSQLGGTVNSYPLAVRGNIELQDQQLSADNFQVSVGDNTVKLKGAVNEGDGVDWRIDAPELSQLYAELSGQLAGNGQAKVLLDGSRLSVKIDQLTGKVNDYPVTAKGEVKLVDQLVSAEDLQLNVGDNSVRLNGVANEAEGISWAINAPQLVQLHPELSGHLQGKGAAKGLLDGSRFALTVAQLDGEVRDYPVSAQGTIRLDNQLMAAEDFQLSVGTNSIELNGVANETDGINWVLDAPALAQLHPELSGDLQGKGSAKGLLDGSRFAVDVERLQGEIKDYPVSAQGVIKLNDQLLSAEDFRIAVADNKLILGGTFNETAGIDWWVDAPALAQLYPGLTGNVQAKGNVKGLLDGSNLSLQIAQLDGTINDYPLSGQGGIRLKDERLSAQALQLRVGANEVDLDGLINGGEGARWRINAPKLAQLHPTLSGQLQGEGQAKALLDSSFVSLNIAQLSGEVNDYPVSAQGRIRLEDALVSADDFQVNVGDNKVVLKGTANEAEGINWMIDAPKLTQLYPELKGRLKGRGNAKGLLDGSKLSINVEQLDGRVQGYPVSAQGEVKLDNQRVSADDFQVSVGDNKIELNGVANETQGIDWMIDAPQLAQLHPELSGRLQGNGNAQGLLDGSRLALKVEQLEGRVKGYAVSAQGDLNLEDQLISADNFAVKVGDNEILLNGVANEAEGVNWTVDAPKLAQLYPDLSGYLKGNGNVQGLLDGSSLRLKVANLEGKVQTYPVQASGIIQMKDQLLSANNFKVAVGENTIRLDGAANDQDGVDWVLDAPALGNLHPALAGSNARGGGNLKGRLDGSEVALTINQLKGEVKGYALSAQGDVKLSDQVISADDFQVSVGDNSVVLNGVANESEGLDWNIDAPQLAQISPKLKGRLRGKGNVSGKLDGSQLSLTVDQLDGRVQGFEVAAQGKVTLNDQQVSADNFEVSMGDNTLNLNGTANETQGVDWALDAPDLSQISPTLTGSLKGKGNAKGLLDGSRLSVNADQLNGNVNGLPVATSGEIKLKDNKLSTDNLRFNIGENEIRLSGIVDESTGINWTLDAPKLSQVAPELSGRLQGTGNVKGLLDGSRLSIEVAQVTGNIQGVPVAARGQIGFDNQLLSANNFRVNAGKNTLSLNGTVDEQRGINWVLDAPELAQISPYIKGHIKGSGNATGRLDGSKLGVRIDQLTGRVNSFPVSAKGNISYHDNVLAANDLYVSAGSNTIRLDGVADESRGLNWSLNAPKLAQINPGINGHLKGQGLLKGKLDGSSLTARINTLSGRVMGYPVNADGEVRFRNSQLSVSDLRANLGANAIRISGVLDEKTGLNWSLNAQQLKQINPALNGQLKGRGNIIGKLDGSRVVLNIAELNGRVNSFPVSAKGTVQLRNQQQLSVNNLQVNVGANALRVNGVLDERTGLSWTLNAQKLVQINPALDGQLKGRGNIIGKLDGSRVVLNIAALNGRVKGFPVSAAGTVQLRQQKLLSVNNLRVNVGANALRLDGQLDDKAGINWQLDAKNLAQLSPSIKGSVRGNGNIKGALDGSRFTARVNVLQGRINEYPLRVSGEISGNGKIYTARNVLLNAGQNTLKLNGSIGDAVGLNWQLDARNIAQIVPGVKASARGNGTIQGKVDGSQLRVQIARLNGQVEGRPLNVTGAVDVQGQRIQLNNIQINAGGNLLAVNGQVGGQALNLTWKINARNLAQAWPGLAGSLQGEGTVKGNASLPQVQGYLKGSNVRYQDIAVQALDIKVGQNGRNYNLTGTLRNLRQGDNIVTHVDIKGQGTPERHTVTLAAIHKAGKLNVNLSGSLNNGQWNGAINSLGLRDTVAGNWQLTAPIRISASEKAFTVTNSCLANRQNARVCAQVNWAANTGLVAKGVVQQVPLAMAGPFLPKNIQLPGRLNADFQLEQRGGKPFGRLNAQLPDNVVGVRTERGNVETFQYTNARANIVLNDRNATVDVQLDVRGHGQFRTNGTIMLSPGNQQHRVDLRSTVSIPSITWMQRFSPQVDALKGQVTGDVRIAGLLTRPQITGTARLQGGSLYLPETGSRLTDINLNIQAQNADQLAINGTLNAGGGQLTAKGVLRFGQLPNWSANVKVQGNNLLLMNSYEAQVRVSPNLDIKATPQSVAITGRVLIPYAKVNISELPPSASVRSDDIVIVGRDTQQPAPNKVRIAEDSGKPLYIQPNVIVELGNQVSFQGFGLSGRMVGKLRILRNRQDIVGEGVLSVVDGVYQAYGQNLTIERGRLLFSGPIDNPGLDIRAVRKVEDDITVGIEVRGTVETPKSSLFSGPLQTETDTLSYLLTGRGASSLNGAQSAILTQAVTGLGLAGGEGLAQKIGGGLGLDDVGLNAKNGDYRQSELSLGKRLGPNLYVKYIVGLFDSLQKVAITYDINKRLKLEAASGVNQSIDLIYKIDTDRGPFGN